MQKCFYHAKTDAVTTCMGCKMPVCQTCQEDGQRGFCERCMKKVAQLSATVTDTKKTGIMSSHKATMLKTAGRPTGPKNVTFCFQHFEAVASGTCLTCNRAFCQACSAGAGICTHCAQYEREQQAAAAPAPTRSGPLAGEGPARRGTGPVPAARKKTAGGPSPLVLGAIALVGLVVIMGLVMRKPAAPRAVAPTPIENPAASNVQEAPPQ